MAAANEVKDIPERRPPGSSPVEERPAVALGGPGAADVGSLSPAVFTVLGISGARFTCPGATYGQTRIGDLQIEYAPGPFALEVTARLYHEQAVSLRFTDDKVVRQLCHALGVSADMIGQFLSRETSPRPAARASRKKGATA
jgi:hypothetical protein